MKSWIMLSGAIVTEIIGTVAMKYSDGLSKLLPSVLVFIFYVASTGLMAASMDEIDLSIAYSVWSGVGILASTLLGWWLFKEQLPASKILFIALILIGVVGLYLWDQAPATME